jgi:hypothetical protein
MDAYAFGREAETLAGALQAEAVRLIPAREVDTPA